MLHELFITQCIIMSQIINTNPPKKEKNVTIYIDILIYLTFMDHDDLDKFLYYRTHINVHYKYKYIISS